MRTPVTEASTVIRMYMVAQLFAYLCPLTGSSIQKNDGEQPADRGGVHRGRASNRAQLAFLSTSPGSPAC